MRRLVVLAALLSIVGLSSAALVSAQSGPDLRAATDQALQAERDASDQEKAALQERIAELEASLTPTPTTPAPTTPVPTTPAPTSPPPSTCTVTVATGGSIQAAVNASPAGATICLQGELTVATAVLPKDGQSFVGPAIVRGVNGADEGIQAKHGADAEDVTIDDLEMTGFDLRPIGCWQGMVVRNSYLHDNGRNGIGCGLEGGGPFLAEDNRIDSNGHPDHTGGGAAGIKIANGDGVVIRGNTFVGNIGNGVWCDRECGSFTVRENIILGSTRKGVAFEVSRGPALIVDNVVQDNNCSPVYWPNPEPNCDLPNGFGPQGAGAPGGGIATNSSCPAVSSCIIRGNILGGNMVAGINFRDDGRPDDKPFGYDQPFNILAELNQMNGDRVLNCDLRGITCRNNG